MRLLIQIWKYVVERHWVTRYVVALGMFGVAALVSVPVKSWVGYSSTSIFLVAVMVSAWYGGLGPGLLVTVLSSAFSVYVLFDPVFSLSIGLAELIRLGAFSFAAVIISSLTARTRDAEQTVRELNKHLEERVKTRTAELEQANERLRSFCYSIAHDLRAPLRSVQGFAHALREEYSADLDDTAKDYASRMMRSSERMDRLICDLLNYAELTTREVELARVELEGCVRHVVQEMEASIVKSKAQIEVVSPLHPVFGNASNVELIIRHLLDNGMKFVRPGTVPRLRIWTEVMRDRIRLNIEDNGIGIEPEQHERIFGIFNRIHSAAEYGGTGIGLAMVKAAAGQMQARVGLTSFPGRGTCFQVEFMRPPGPSVEPVAKEAAYTVLRPARQF